MGYEVPSLTDKNLKGHLTTLAIHNADPRRKIKNKTFKPYIRFIFELAIVGLAQFCSEKHIQLLEHSDRFVIKVDRE